MTITFPLTTPTSPKPSRIQWFQQTTSAISRSKFTGHQQSVEWDGGLWGVGVTYPPMRRAAAAPLIAFLMALRGRRGTFAFGSHLFGTPQGSPGGTPKVKGAGQVGYTLACDGFPNSTLVAKACDMVQINTQVYVILTDATTDGTGNVTFDIWPNARNHADNSDLDFSSPTLSMRLTDSIVIPFEEVTDKWYSIAFTAEEVK